MACIVKPKYFKRAPTFEFEPKWPSGADLPTKETTSYLMYHGLPVPPERFPKKAILKSSHKIKNDVLDLGKWGVSERVREIWERFAPRQIEYMPIDVVRKNGEHVNGHRYSFTNILNRFGTICWAEVTWAEVERKTGYRYVDLPREYALGKRKLGIKLNRTSHEDIHIWHEDNASQLSGWVFVSDALAEAMRTAEITDLEYEHIEEETCLLNRVIPSRRD